MLECLGGRSAQRDAINYDPIFAFEIDAELVIREGNVIKGAVKAVRNALVHERSIDWERIQSKGDLHQFAMGFERRAVEPLPSPRQRGAKQARVKWLSVVVNSPCEFTQSTFRLVPSFNRRKKIWPHRPNGEGAQAVFSDDHQLTVRRPVSECCQAHDQSSMIATARVQPAEAPLILCGKQLTVKPRGGSDSRVMKLFEVAIADITTRLVSFPDQ